jgi:AP2 domain/HNH endonuclease
MKLIPLSQRLFSMVDDDMFETLGQMRWYAQKDGRTFYARGYVGENKVWLHHLVLNPEDGTEIDHVDGNGLNNQRANLARVTHAQNTRKSRTRKDSVSGAKGVCLRPSGKWRAYFYRDGRQVSVGEFPTKEIAAEARRIAVIRFDEQ